MDIRDLGRLDLNLLVALEALLEERSVSRAADRLFVTQSAMSKTLGRLRELFDDPLFVRKATGMVPTPRAEQLAVKLPQLLQSVQDVFQPVQFDPLEYTGVFNLLIHGHVGIWMIPRLMDLLGSRAPGIRLRALSIVDRPFEQLDSGQLDFLVQAELHKYPADLRLTTLGYAPPVMLARKGHPLEGKVLTWEAVLQYPHVQLIIAELADIHFQAGKDASFVQNLAKLVPNLVTDQLSTAIQLVRQSDYLFPAPPLFMEQQDLSDELIALQVPEGEGVTLKYVLVDHQRVTHSAAHEFLFQQMLEVVESFRKQYGLLPLAQLREKLKLAY